MTAVISFNTVAVSNVLLVTIDSLRADYASLREEMDPLSETRAALANPVTFTQAVANGPNTPSSFPSILTGTYPLMYGGYDYLDERRPFLAKTLSEAGFETVAYHSNPHLGSNHNYDTGFRMFNDSAEGSDAVAGLKDRVENTLDPESRLYSLLRRVWHYVTLSTETGAYARASTITDDAVDWFDNRDDDSPFFAWLHYMDVHYPFTPPNECLINLGLDMVSKRRITDLNGRMQEDPGSLTETDVETLLDLYVGEIRYVDEQLRRVLDYLKAEGILKETAVFVTADHGEAFGEHGRFGHHSRMYDELLRVPMLASVLGYDGREVDRQVPLIDLSPTIYDLVGVDTPDAAQGVSFEPLLRGQEREEREKRVAVGTAAGGDILSCRTPEWKCLQRVDGAVELYNLTDDPGETRDVSFDYPDVVDRFVDRLEVYRREAERTDAYLPSVEDDEAVKQRLKDLGYMD